MLHGIQAYALPTCDSAPCTQIPEIRSPRPMNGVLDQAHVCRSKFFLIAVNFQFDLDIRQRDLTKSHDRLNGIRMGLKRIKEADHENVVAALDRPRMEHINRHRCLRSMDVANRQIRSFV